MRSAVRGTVAYVNRLTILPGLRRLWREPDVVQFGVDPATATVVELPDTDVARVLTLLDGSRHERAVVRDASAIGIPPEHVTDLLTALREAGVLVSAETLMPDSFTEPARRQLAAEAAARAITARVDSSVPDAAETLRRRRSAAVAVRGSARLAVPIASALAAAGIGHVDAQLRGRVRTGDTSIGGLALADLGRPRGTAAADVIRRASSTVETGALRHGAASFVVQIGQRAPAELSAHGFARRKAAHLLIEERDASILVGPLVPAGGSPCLHCLDLHRHDRDPAWPALMAQIATSVDETASTATSTVLIAVGVAVAQVLSHIDGGPPATALGATIEVASSATIRRRSWPPHPRCDCSRRANQRRVGRPSAA